jgi:hypothetical protein
MPFGRFSGYTIGWVGRFIDPATNPSVANVISRLPRTGFRQVNGPFNPWHIQDKKKIQVGKTLQGIPNAHFPATLKHLQWLL